MKLKKVDSERHLFPIIIKSMILMILFLCFLAIFIHAPLQTPANPAIVPNPSKSAWFLLWMQELVSYTGYPVFLILGIGFIFLLYPRLYRNNSDENASWFSKNIISSWFISIVIFISILLLTIIAEYFRGPYWQLRLPW